MKCRKALKLLPLFVSDDLPVKELDEVEAHVGSCLSCFRAYQEQLKAHRALKLLGERPDLSPMMEGFHEEVMARVARDGGGPAAPVPRLVYPAVRRYVAAAAVIAAAFTAFYFLTPPRGGSEGPSIGPGYGYESGPVAPTAPVNLGKSPFIPRLYLWPMQGKSGDGENLMRRLGPDEGRRRMDSLKPLRPPRVILTGETRDF